MNELEFLADRFEDHRDHLGAVAYRMLGSVTEAEDAVQEAWLRLAGADAIDNLGGWLTTVVSRVCLDVLRSRRAHPEESLEARQLPDPVITRDSESNPEQQALLADSVGMALLVVLESLSPAQRLAFVLHDMFALPFEQIAPIVDRTPQTAKKLASQARRRVQGEAPMPDTDRIRQRRVVDAFLAAARDGDFDALLTILDPDVVLRADIGAALPGGLQVLRGAAVVAGQAQTFQRMALLCTTHPVLVNGLSGLVNTAADGGLVSVMSFTVTGGRIAAIDLLSAPDRLARLDLAEIIG
ncbi:sigma-70 family RNA polymerase sigma factor [Nocardia crassostreae]|uniref:sigma-70 family RNA polymerase sigma factor n=1 Tax=Nocardia crassostreae TaxID=53428 RepID=UPI0008378D68|nr:sigma-70 family RNA polymerase sigma factor [Nocardia crassostreae]